VIISEEARQIAGANAHIFENLPEENPQAVVIRRAANVFTNLWVVAELFYALGGTQENADWLYNLNDRDEKIVRFFIGFSVRPSSEVNFTKD
jgi:hypothetical protein